MRSWLRMRRPSREDCEATLASDADVVVFDFNAAPWLARTPRRAPRLVAEIGERIEDELDAVMSVAPWAILVACARGADVQRWGAKLAVREARVGLAAGSTRIVARIGDAGVLNLASFAGASPRLVALLLDGRGRAADVLRRLVAVGAAAAGVVAIDSAGDPRFLHEEAVRARDEGFSGKIATTPEQAKNLNAVFSV